jgi:hypothetical protein
MDHTVSVVADAVADDVCRHCGNSRNDGTPAPDLCTECGRCHSDIRACRDSPNCVTRDPEYAGAESLTRYGAPTVVSTVPADAATDVSVDTGLTVTFSHPMNPDYLDWVIPGPIWLLALDPPGISPEMPILEITWSADGKTATIYPVAPLDSGAHYKLVVSCSVGGENGVPLGPTPQSIEGVRLDTDYVQATGFVTESAP